MTSAEARFPPSDEWSAVAPSHEWARTTEEQDMDYVYHGRIGSLPKSSAKIVRIFLSSTFTDTVVERNMLMKHVFPQMRQYCRDKYDLDFQVDRVLVHSIYLYQYYMFYQVSTMK